MNDHCLDARGEQQHVQEADHVSDCRQDGSEGDPEDTPALGGAFVRVQAGDVDDRPTVLILDDNLSVHRMLADALHPCRDTVVEAAGGQEVFDVAQLSRSALIPLDHLVVADPHAPQFAESAQVVGFLAKPFEMDSLLGAVEPG